MNFLMGRRWFWKLLGRVRNSPESLRETLHIEMAPESLWGMNLRSDFGLGRYRWDKLRKALIAERG